MRLSGQKITIRERKFLLNIKIDSAGYFSHSDIQGKIKRQTKYRLLKQLRKKNIIKRIGKGIYQLTETGKKAYKKIIETKGKVRAHNIGWKYRILSKDFLKQVRSKYPKIKNLPYEGYRVENEFGQILITTKHIIVVFREYYAKDTHQALIETRQIADKIIKDFKEKHPTLRVGQVSKQVYGHFALEEHPQTELLDDEQAKGVIYKDAKGNERLRVDKSHGVAEVEATNPRKANEDFNLLLELTKILPKEYTKTIDFGLLVIKAHDDPKYSKLVQVLLDFPEAVLRRYKAETRLLNAKAKLIETKAKEVKQNG